MQSITFTGATKQLKNRYVRNRQGVYAAIRQQKNNDFDSILGTVPYQWIINIKPEKRKEFVQNLYRTLANFSHHARASSSYSLDIDTSKLKQNLNKIGLPVTDISPMPNQGSYGGVICIKVGTPPNDKKYALKIFYETYENNIHGNISEQKIALLFNHRTQNKKNLARFYFGDVASGYMVCDYIDKNSPKKKHFFPQTQGFIFIDAHDDNIINNYIIDYGGFRVANDLVTNSEARKKVKIIENTPENKRNDLWIKIFNATNTKFDQENKQINISKEINDNYLALSVAIIFLNKEEQPKAIENLLNQMEKMPEKTKLITARGLSSIIIDIEKLYPANYSIIKTCCEKLLELNDKTIERNLIKVKIAEKIIKEKTYF